MTTNVCNLLPDSKVFACDSRWSYETDDFFYYIDDSGYDKICYTDKVLAVFAGNASVIDSFKIWINNGCIGDMPSPEGASIIVYNFVDDTHFKRNHSFTLPSKDVVEVIFSGSGTRDAIRSWRSNKCAVQAVKDACVTDLYTGGREKFFDIQSRNNNISSTQLELSQLFNLLLREGFVMKKQVYQTMPYPLKDCVNDPEIRNDLFALSSGKASFDAPSPEAEMKWDEEEVQELNLFFQKCR